MKRKKFILYLVLGCLFSSAINETTGTEIAIQVGTEKSYTDDKIGRHLAYGFFFHIPVCSRSVLRIGVDYFQKRFQWSRQVFKYRGTTYIASNTQLWKDYSLDMALFRKLSHWSSCGIGISADLIKLKRIVYDPYFRFLIDQYNAVVPNINEKKDVWLLRPGVFAVIGSEWSILSKIILILEVRYKSTFVGKATSHSPLQSLSISSGLKFRLK